jgi:hypothetical protein
LLAGLKLSWGNLKSNTSLLKMLGRGSTMRRVHGLCWWVTRILTGNWRILMLLRILGKF